MLKKILAVLALLSLAGNGVLYGMWQHSEAETKTLVSETVTAANERLTESLSHQGAAFEAREATWRRRLELSNQVTLDARARAEVAHAAIREYQRQALLRASQDALYEAWRDEPLPPGVLGSLRDLQNAP